LIYLTRLDQTFKHQCVAYHEYSDLGIMEYMQALVCIVI